MYSGHDKALFHNLLKGNFKDIPKDRSKVVRIFLSSTFTDTHEERDYLIENIFPRLKTYCKQQYGLDFYVADMRWGISHEATNNHMATKLCINEIKNCQRYSLGPNFIGFLSQRYGARVLPTRILADEYQVLKTETLTNPHFDLTFEINDLKINDILDHCYRLDENEIPFRYRLLNLNSIISNYNEKDPKYSKLWDEIETKLRQLLQNAADNCHRKGQLTDVQRERYFVSVTEKEIYNGLIKAQNTKQNVLMFIREIEDIKDNIKSNAKLAGRFIDLDERGDVDTDAENLLNSLKMDKIAKYLPESNIHKFKVKWDPNGGVTRKTHPDYMEEFGETFFKAVKELIDQNARQPYYLDNFDTKDKQLLQEIVEHANFCNECVEKFHGRIDLLDRMKQYILDDSFNKPFIVHGESGCGKTSVIAKLANEVFKFVPDPDNYVMILRFLGTTPGTSSIITVLLSIIYQLSRIFDLDLVDNIRLEHAELKDYLISQLIYISRMYRDKKLVILLDSIDQLNTSDYAIGSWMIMNLPSNVKMIYSTLPGHGDILQQIRDAQLLGDGIDNQGFLEVTSLNNTIVKTILEDWLNRTQRSLSESQWNVLETVFEKSKLYPLYVKLIYDIIVKWTSYDEPSAAFKKLNNIDSTIKYLFTMLEAEHGRMLFRRTMCYMSTFKNGISESELEDILSIDDDVLFEIFEFHAPPVRRFPGVLWTRIKHDLSEYMVEKEIHDTRVIYWYHRRFIEVANSFYISVLNSAERENVFSNVVDFFNETWKDKPKPYRYNDHIAKKKQMATDEAEASRNTAIQPTEFVAVDGKIRYNKRKLTELPNFISQLTANLAIPLACTHIYFNYAFLHGLFVCCNYPEVLDQLHKFTDLSSYAMSNEARDANSVLKLLSLAFLQCGISVSDYPETLGVQLVSRLLIFQRHYRIIGNFIGECDKLAVRHCALVAPYQMYQPSGIGPLFTLEKHTKPIVQCIMGGDNDSFVFTLSDKVHVFNMTTLATMGDFKLPKLPTKTDQYKKMRIFIDELMDDEKMQINNANGFVVVTSKHLLHSFNFDGTVNFTKTFDSEIVNNIYLLTPRHILVSFENQNYFDIYNVNKGARNERKLFEMNIKCLTTDFCDDIVHPTSNKSKNEVLWGKLNYASVVVIVLDNSVVRILQITGNTANDVLNLAQVEKTWTQTPGIDCRSCVFMEQKDIKTNFDFTGVNRRSFGLSFADGSFLAFTYEVNPNDTNFKSNLGDLKILKVKEPQTQDVNMYLDFLDICADINAVLFLCSNRQLCLYFDDEANASCVKINGSYDNGCFIAKKLICGYYKGIVDIYATSLIKYLGSKTVKVVKIKQIEAHYNDITRLFVKDQMILTTSKDTTMKVFMLNPNQIGDDDAIKFDRVDDEIDYIAKYNQSCFITQSSNSKNMTFWDASSGTIVNTIKTTFDRITEFERIGMTLLAIGTKTYSKTKLILAKGFVINNNNRHRECFELIIKDSIDVKLVKTSETFVIFSKCETNGNMQVYRIKYNQEAQSWSHGIVDNLAGMLGTTLDFQLDIGHVAITDLNELILFYHNRHIFLIDSTQKTLIGKHEFDHELKFRQNSSLTLFHAVKGKNDLLTLTSSNRLVYIELSQDRVVVHQSQIQNANFTQYLIESNSVCAYDTNNSKLLCFDISRSKSFDHKLFELSYQDDTLNSFALSPNCDYIATIQNPRILSLYRVNDSTCIAQLPLYSEVNCISLTDEYIALAMQDRRLITYLIVDIQNNLHPSRIMALQSRNSNETNKRNEQKTTRLIERLTGMLDHSSSDELSGNEIFNSDDDSVSNEKESDQKVQKSDDEENWEKSVALRRMKKNVHKIPMLDMISIVHKQDEMKWDVNWMLELNKIYDFIYAEQLKFLAKKEEKPVLNKWKTVQFAVSADLKNPRPIEDTNLNPTERNTLIKILTNQKTQMNLKNTNKTVRVTNTDHTASSLCLIM